MGLKRMVGFVVLLITLSCQAQQGKVKSMVLLTSGDTIVGYIREKSLRNFEAAIPVFVEKTNAEMQLLTGKIKAVVSEDGKTSYSAYNVTLDLSYIDKLKLAVKNEEDTLKTVLLLKKIYTGGKLDLYYYYTDAKEFFFICFNGQMEELVVKYKTYEGKTYHSYENLYRIPSYTTLPYFRDQLLKYFDWQSNEKLAREIDDLTYEKAKILTIIRKIDES